MNNFLVVGNNELGEDVGDEATCPNCGKKHVVQYGDTVTRDSVTGEETKTPSRLLAYVRCGSKTYLVALDGKIIKEKS